MSDSLEHHCALAGMRARPKCRWNVPSAIEALIYEQWNRGGAGWGLRGIIDGKMEAETSGKGRTTLCHTMQKKSTKEELVTTAVGHGRYVTSGMDDPMQSQPFTFETAGLTWAFAFNGNLANYGMLKQELGIGKPDVDTEAIRRLMQQEIEERTERIQTDVRGAMREVFSALEQKLDGCFNIVLINTADQLFAYRDRHAFRPLVWTKTKSGDVLVASEDSAIKRIFSRRQIEPIQHIGAGELFAADDAGEEILRIADPELARCFFEYVYFARDLSELDAKSVARVRKALGTMLAYAEHGEECERGLPYEQTQLQRVLSQTRHRCQDVLHRATGQRFRKEKYQNAICLGVPKSGTTAGFAFARELGIPYVQAVERVQESDRSFTKGSPEERVLTAEEKFEYHPSQIAGKDLYLVEDSVVRGTTMQVLSANLRAKGARSIHLRITCPAVIGPCFYGIDFPTIRELLLGKYRREIIENGWKLPKEIEAIIAEQLRVDSVKFLSVSSMLAVFEHCGIDSRSLCTACIHGTQEAYPTPTGRSRLQLAVLGKDEARMTGE